MREYDNIKFPVGECFGMEPLSNIRGVVHVVRSNYTVKPFCNASAQSYHYFYLNRSYRNEMVLEQRFGGETVV